MEAQLDPMKDDLPLMANTSYMLVKHYILDLDVDFQSKVIEGIIVLFFETGSRYRKTSSTGKEVCQSQFDETCKIRASEPCHVPVTKVSACSSKTEYNDFAICGKGEEDTSDKNGNHSNKEQASGISSSKDCCDIENHGKKDFLLVLDCCDLSVLKVEEVDVAAVSGIEKFTRSAKLTDVSKELENLRNQIVHELVTLPADRWKEQLYYFTCCSQAPSCGELLFTTGTWSLEIRKPGIKTPTDFPHAIRIWYKTKPEGRSITWTTDQSGRPCVYTMGSPINNRALFPCQEPPVALSTWQASVRTAAGFVVLMSGENSAEPVQLREGILSWYYYVTMPMPASTFTIAVGCWQEVKQQSFTAAMQTNIEFSLPSSQVDFRWHEEICGHVEYPCRFQNPAARLQTVIPYRVFAPCCLMEHCKEHLLQLIPQCLSAAYTTLGTHPFSRLDVLIVPSNFSSLGMARSGLTVESIFQNWLDTSGIPKPLLEEGETWKECQLVQQVSGEVTKWIQTNQRIRKSSKKKRKQDEVIFQKLLPDQLVLLLETLLEEKTLCPRILQSLEKTYQLREQDAEVRHRWCELVVKQKYVPAYGDVEKFLREDQAMGVYLYGELMVNEDAKQQELAHKCFAAAREHMDVSSASVVAEMLF